MDKKNKKDDKKSLIGFIPHRLEIEGWPELSNFPFNVLFSDWQVVNEQIIQGSTVYEPDFSTFEDGEESQKMEYRNKHGGDCWLIIVFNKKKKTYEGKKYVNGKLVLLADGADWKGFFAHFTILGLSNGETCFFKGPLPLRRPEGIWKIEGFDTFDGEFYPLKGEYLTEQEAIEAAEKRLEELERDQPTSESGGQTDEGIQDKVYVIRPDGTAYRFIV